MKRKRIWSEKGRQKREDKRSRLIRKSNFQVGDFVVVNKGEGESGRLLKWFGRYRVLEGHESNTLAVKRESQSHKAKCRKSQVLQRSYEWIR